LGGFLFFGFASSWLPLVLSEGLCVTADRTAESPFLTWNAIFEAEWAFVHIIQGLVARPSWTLSQIRLCCGGESAVIVVTDVAEMGTTTSE
jgi:hypothetical protein